MRAIPANSTAKRVLDYLEAFDIKAEAGEGKFRSNSPFRPDSDSHSFCLKIDDGEHGAYFDQVSGANGSLYKLADYCGIPHPDGKRDEVTNTKRVISNLDEYACDHGLPGEYLRSKGWKQTTYYEHGIGHPAIEFPTAAGKRWRLLDVTKGVYRSKRGYKPCWFGLDKALSQNASILVMCNGEISVVAATYYGIDAICLTAGEKAIPENLLKEFKAKVQRDQAILIALDCDKKGQDTAINIRDQLITAGYTNVRAVDLLLESGGDLADLCKLYTTDVAARLPQLPDLASDENNAIDPKPKKPDNDAAATLWADKYGEDRRYDPVQNEWRHWDGKYWKTEEGRSIEHEAQVNECLKELKLGVTYQRIKDTLNLCGIHAHQVFKSTTLNLLNFHNGTLDLGSGKLRAHEREDGLIDCLPYAYQDGGSYPTIARVLEQNIPDQEGRRAYMAHIGGALAGDTSFHKCLIIYGLPRSGKTTLVNIAQRTCGHENDSFAGKDIFFADLEGKRARYTWHDRRMVCLDEFPADAINEEGEDLFKAMAAHSGVSMRGLYRDEDTNNKWRPKLIFATNNKPRLLDRSHAAFRRIIVISCQNERPDNELEHKLESAFDIEIGAFAAACLKVWSAVVTANCYPESAAMQALRSIIEHQGDDTKQLLYEQFVIDPGSFEPTASIYSAYQAICAKNGVKPLSRPKLIDTIQGLFPSVTPAKRRVKGFKNPACGLSNIRFRTDSDPDPFETVPLVGVAEQNGTSGGTSEKSVAEGKDKDACSAVPVIHQRNRLMDGDKENNTQVVICGNGNIVSGFTGTVEHPPANLSGSGVKMPVPVQNVSFDDAGTFGRSSLFRMTPSEL